MRYKLKNVEGEEREDEEVGSVWLAAEGKSGFPSEALLSRDRGRKLQGQRLPFRDVSWLDARAGNV